MRVISLGWGLQSFAMAAMSALGELPPVDAAIHADTTHEREATYAFAARWTPWLEERGVKVVTVQAKNTNPIRTWRKGPIVTIPAFTTAPKGGSVTRQCTGDWKIDPKKRWFQEHRRGRRVEQWLGITTDEIGRVKASDVQYILHRWPFIELGMNRGDVRRWLMSKGLEVPPRSACVFCPFHSAREWREIRTSADWENAVNVDEAIRNVESPLAFYLHKSRIPLRQIDFRSEQEKGQLELWDNECTGHCGL